VTDDRPAGKALAVDLGSRRVGLAVCDGAGSMAFPYAVIDRAAEGSRDAEAIARALAETGATTVVVGLPLSLDGTEGPAARQARQWADRRSEQLADTEVVLFDERLTTVSAQSALHAAGRRGRKARATIDSAAATVLLQSWLDAGRPTR